jgi:hypothetical protein
MSLKGLPIIKCTNCGKTTIVDEYELNGCPNCGSTTSGVDFGIYRRRENLGEIGEGVHTFTGRFKKVGNLFYRNHMWYALIENVRCGPNNFLTNHTYVANISFNSVVMLKQVEPGTEIMFKARINNYDKRTHKWGMDHMHHVVPLTNPHY